MKLSNLTESLEKNYLNESVLTEADNRNIKDLLKNKFNQLDEIKQIVAKNLNSTNIINNVDKFKNYATVVEWVAKLADSLKEVSNSSDEQKITKAIGYTDMYMKEILKALKSGQAVQESLISESLNCIYETLDNKENIGE